MYDGNVQDLYNYASTKRTAHEPVVSRPQSDSKHSRIFFNTHSAWHVKNPRNARLRFRRPTRKNGMICSVPLRLSFYDFQTHEFTVDFKEFHYN